MGQPDQWRVDRACVSAERLAQACEEGREMIGPALASPRKAGRLSVEDFDIHVSGAACK